MPELTLILATPICRTERITVSLEDLFISNPGSWDGDEGGGRLNRQLVDQLTRGPVLAYRDEDAAYRLVCLLEVELPGNDQDARLTDQEVADVLRCTDAVLARLKITSRIPFRTRRGYWQEEKTQGNITEFCGLILQQLANLEADASRSGFRGVKGDPLNVIFAATQKPELAWVNFDQGIFEITKNAEHCLKYDRPIPVVGLTVTDVLDWWKHRDGIYSLSPVAQLQRLKTQLEGSCSPKSPPERHLLRVYWEFAKTRGFNTTPAILPQVYLHYDPIAQKDRDRQNGRVIPVQVRDFMLFAPGGRRIILEIDGKEHYSVGDEPAPKEYAKMTKEDRRLRLQGYEVYRFGGYEFQDRQEPDKMLMEFFAALLAV
ncbi:hypothetical protein ACWIID_02275 [Streptomyces phaeochromogenes]